jgi:hypothetical protein
MAMGCLFDAVLPAAPGRAYTTTLRGATTWPAAAPVEAVETDDFAAFDFADAFTDSVFEDWSSTVTLPLTTPAARALETIEMQHAIRGRENKIR